MSTEISKETKLLVDRICDRHKHMTTLDQIWANVIDPDGFCRLNADAFCGWYRGYAVTPDVDLELTRFVVAAAKRIEKDGPVSLVARAKSGEPQPYTEKDFFRDFYPREMQRAANGCLVIEFIQSYSTLDDKDMNGPRAVVGQGGTVADAFMQAATLEIEYRNWKARFRT